LSGGALTTITKYDTIHKTNFVDPCQEVDELDWRTRTQYGELNYDTEEDLIPTFIKRVKDPRQIKYAEEKELAKYLLDTQLEECYTVYNDSA
jgi:hypothetical protein